MVTLNVTPFKGLPVRASRLSIGTSTLTQNGIFTTDSSGEIKITNLAPGAYVLTEIKAPTGYVMDTAGRSGSACPE